MKEVRGVFEAGFRIDGGQALGLAVGECGDGADLGDEARGVEGEALLALGDEVRVVGGGRVDHGRKDGHRVGGGREVFEMETHSLVQHLVFREHVGELDQLGAGRKVAVDQQVGRLDEGAFFREFGDVVAAVAKDSRFAIDEGDGAFAGTRIAVSRIKGDATGLIAERRDIHPDFTLGAYDGWQLDRLAINDHFHGSIHARGI